MNIKRDALIGQALGIGAALIYGISSVLIRQGVASLAPPLVGATVALLSGTLALAVFGTRGLGASLRQSRRSVGLILLSGAASGLGVLTSFLALSIAPVVIVSPLQSTSPLFVLLLSHLFLSRLEKITRRLVLGSLLVVFGVVLITIGKAI